METTVWEWPISIDLWAAGVAGGGFFAAFLINRLTGGKHKRLLQIATWVGVPLALLGVLLLVLDLGNQIWFWHLMVNPSAPFLTFYGRSAMSIGTWVLTVWSASGVGLIALWFAELFEPKAQASNGRSVSAPSGLFARVASWFRPLIPAATVLSWISFLLSPPLIAYTGVLLSNTNVPLWTTIFLPALFVTSAIFTGTAATQFVATLLGTDVPKELGTAGLILALLQALALVGFLVTVPSWVLVAGPLALWFWIGGVLVGLVLPFGLELWALQAKRTASLVLASTLCVLVGGLALRAMVVIGGQM